MADDKIGEQLQKIRDLEKLRDQTQSMIDSAIYELVTIAGGKTFEHGSKYYQIRTPNTSRTDRQRKATEHPFLCELEESPKTAKARAKEKREADKAAKAVEQKALAEEQVKANLAAVLSAPTPSDEDDSMADVEEEQIGDSDEDMEEPLAASDDSDDDDGIVMTGGDE